MNLRGSAVFVFNNEQEKTKEWNEFTNGNIKPIRIPVSVQSCFFRRYYIRSMVVYCGCSKRNKKNAFTEIIFHGFFSLQKMHKQIATKKRAKNKFVITKLRNPFQVTFCCRSEYVLLLPLFDWVGVSYLTTKYVFLYFSFPFTSFLPCELVFLLSFFGF